jgi:hypothetical protein
MSKDVEGWAVVDLVGEGRPMIAGYVQMAFMGDLPLVAVDVPETPDQEAFSTVYAPASIRSITPCTEEQALEAAIKIRARPIHLWIPNILPS